VRWPSGKRTPALWRAIPPTPCEPGGPTRPSPGSSAAPRDYALSFALLFQLHDHVARQILHQDPHDTDYYGNREVGDFLRRLMAPGASRPWRDILRETTGRELHGKAMVEYFAPLYQWLQQENRGRHATLPEL
jgi:peptidyl-dipeptidase A